jgi:lipopolysaccharide cholinephosphotransferase
MDTKTRTVQLIELDILTNFINICDKHNLRYYIIGGALIGTLRHKGFIPWDDDIDIGMPRNDYEYFLEISKDTLPDGYALSNHQTDPTWFFNMSQIIDKRVVIDILMNETPRRFHAWIDLFPLDGLPKNSLRRWLHIKRILFYRYLIQIKHIKTQVNTHKVGRPLYEKFILKLFKIIPVSNLINSEKYLLRLNKCLKKYDYEKSDYAGNMLGRYREREAVPKTYFGEPLYLPFENITVSVPAKYHELQTALYGDYMQIPPEGKREQHFIVELSFDTTKSDGINS